MNRSYAGLMQGWHGTTDSGQALGNPYAQQPIGIGQLDAILAQRQWAHMGIANMGIANMANAQRTPRQIKLDAAKAYLKRRAEHHPEWTVRRA